MWLREREAVNAAVRARKAFILFVHVYKSGGTSLCESARHAGMRTIASDSGTSCRSERVQSGGVWANVYGKNCNPSYGDRHDAWGGNGPYAMLHFSRNLDFYAIETVRPSLLPWGSGALLVVVRHPLHRLLSRCSKLKALLHAPTTAQMSLLPSFARSWVKNATATKTIGAEQERVLQGCFCELRGTLVETLAGVPGGGVDRVVPRASFVTQEAVARASRLLERASVVLVTDRLSDATTVLSATFDWRAAIPKLTPFEAMMARSRGSLAMRPGRRRLQQKEAAAEPRPAGADPYTRAVLTRFARTAPQLHAKYLRETTHEVALYEYASRHFHLRLARARRDPNHTAATAGVSADDVEAERKLWATAPDLAWTATTEPTPLGDCPVPRQYRGSGSGGGGGGALLTRLRKWRDAMFATADGH